MRRKPITHPGGAWGELQARKQFWKTVRFYFWLAVFVAILAGLVV